MSQQYPVTHLKKIEIPLSSGESIEMFVPVPLSHGETERVIEFLRPKLQASEVAPDYPRPRPKMSSYRLG
jgi:hypothetical protein